MGYLPGQFVSVETAEVHGYGSTCDCGAEAITALVGETDSFGSEFHPMCAICKHEYTERGDTEEGTCDWCNRQSVLSPRRDFEEGSSGPVYYVCSPCIAKDNQRINAECGYGDEDYWD